MNKLEQGLADLLSVLTAHDASVKRAMDRVNEGLLTDAGKREAIDRDREREGWVRTVDAVQTMIDDVDRTALEAVDKARAAIVTPQPGNVHEQALAESRAVRAWARLKGILDTHDAVGAEMAGLDALREARGDERRVIVEELPAYLVARDGRLDMTADLERVLRETDDAYGVATAYRDGIARVLSDLQIATQATRRAVMENVRGGTDVDLLVRRSEIMMDDIPKPTAGSVLPDGTRWDAVLGVFR